MVDIIDEEKDLSALPTPKDKEGILYKRGRGRSGILGNLGRRPWSMRFFELSCGDGELRYFAFNEKEGVKGEMKGSFSISHCEINFIPETESGKPYSFELNAKESDCGTEHTTLLMAAQSKREAVQWVQAIKLASLYPEIMAAKKMALEKEQEKVDIRRQEREMERLFKQGSGMANRNSNKQNERKVKSKIIYHQGDEEDDKNVDDSISSIEAYLTPGVSMAQEKNIGKVSKVEKDEINISNQNSDVIHLQKKIISTDNITPQSIKHNSIENIPRPNSNNNNNPQLMRDAANTPESILLGALAQATAHKAGIDDLLKGFGDQIIISTDLNDVQENMKEARENAEKKKQEDIKKQEEEKKRKEKEKRKQEILAKKKKLDLQKSHFKETVHKVMLQQKTQYRLGSNDPKEAYKAAEEDQTVNNISKLLAEKKKQKEAILRQQRTRQAIEREKKKYEQQNNNNNNINIPGPPPPPPMDNDIPGPPPPPPSQSNNNNNNNITLPPPPAPPSNLPQGGWV